VPDDLAQRLKERAARNHRSLQGELMAILEAVTQLVPASRIDEIYAMVKSSGVKTPRGESARIIRWAKMRRHPGESIVLLDAWLAWTAQPPVVAIDLTDTMHLARDTSLT
jgi:antitoxin FitA